MSLDTGQEDLRAPEPLAPPPPYSLEELAAAFRRPDRALAVALAEQERVGLSVCEGRHVALLALFLLLAGLAGTVPYGLLSPAGSCLSTAVLFFGSLGICLPCLHVFAQFCGARFTLLRMLALAATLTCAAGLFTLSFAPIIWFLSWSIEADRWAALAPRSLSVALLAVSLLMGVIHMVRCLVVCERAGWGGRVLGVLVGLWLPLFLFIIYRMAMLLGLL